MSGNDSRLDLPVVDIPASAATTPADAVTFLVGQLVQAGRLRAEQAARVIDDVMHREALSSTCIGRRVAVPHAKSDAIVEVLGIVGRAERPIPWPYVGDVEPV